MEADNGFSYMWGGALQKRKISGFVMYSESDLDRSNLVPCLHKPLPELSVIKIYCRKQNVLYVYFICYL